MSELFKLKNGTVLVSTEAPGGIYNSAQLKKIAELCSKELAIVKATEDQRLALFVKEAELPRRTPYYRSWFSALSSRFASAHCLPRRALRNP